MVEFRLLDDNELMIRGVDADVDLPDVVARVHIDGPFERNKSNQKLLSKMLKSSSKRIETIKICNLSGDSPDFLAFFVLICRKAKSLEIEDCRLSTNAASCLKGALLAFDGIRHLLFMRQDGMAMDTNNAKILLEGVASSPCLECFCFHVRGGFASNQDAGRHLIEALRNQSLERIFLCTCPFAENGTTFLPNLVKASILGPNVKEVTILDTDESEQALGLAELQEVLCREDCILEKLFLKGIEIVAEEDGNGSIVQNSSVKSLTICETSCDSATFLRTISMFKSLVELNLSNNRISRLDFLDPLLFGKKSKLKSLNVSCNAIGDEEMKGFVQKLREIKGLQYLAVGGSGLENRESAITALNDALRHNADLEYFDLNIEGFPFHFNRGGRRAFESSHPVPTNVLPRVLERASEIAYYQPLDDWGRPNNKAVRVDVVFWMVQRIAPQL